MKLTLTPFIFFICLNFLTLKSTAQPDNFYPDSTISYSLNSLDTLSKIPVTRVVNRYSTDFRLQERKQYHWDLKSKQWQPSKRLEIHYYPAEILVEAFQMLNAGIEVHTARLLLKLDPAGKKIIQTTFLLKDKNNENYKRFTQIEYLYRKDTLTSIKKYQQGATYFLEQETTFNRLTKSTWSIKHKTFKESDRSVLDSSLNIILFSAGQETRMTHQLFSTHPFSYKDTLVYKNKRLEYIRHATVNFPKASSELIRENYKIQYAYSTKGMLTSSLTLVENEKGIPKQHVKNQLVYYYCSQNSPIRKQFFYQVDLEKQILAFNELN